MIDIDNIETTIINGREYATEEALLKFVNEVREAGGMELLAGLLPAKRGEAASCLIARGVNFNSEVRYASRYTLPEPSEAGAGGRNWGMFPVSVTDSEIEELAKKLGLPTCGTNWPGLGLGIQLPWEIGSCADVFDRGLAFQEFNINSGDIV